MVLAIHNYWAVQKLVYKTKGCFLLHNKEKFLLTILTEMIGLLLGYFSLITHS